MKQSIASANVKNWCVHVNNTQHTEILGIRTGMATSNAKGSMSESERVFGAVRQGHIVKGNTAELPVMQACTVMRARTGIQTGVSM